eukprot:4934947-Pleurochrysis_carterae.AAC.1
MVCNTGHSARTTTSLNDASCTACGISRSGLSRTYPLRGFATGQFGDGLHEFVLRKGSSGIVRIHSRKSSQSSTRVPEGLGYEVFNSTPPAHPPLAKLRPDSKWEKSTVEGTVRPWLQHFALPPAQIAAARKE